MLTHFVQGGAIYANNGDVSGTVWGGGECSLVERLPLLEYGQSDQTRPGGAFWRSVA